MEPQLEISVVPYSLVLLSSGFGSNGATIQCSIERRVPHPGVCAATLLMGIQELVPLVGLC